ncbi:nucleotide sugar transporter SLC35D2 isoform X2 [Ascaphus truei]|uniref:nucleotide sugar transporter SLC35D2 isoform X2 n=1 Tax=Ascaphus truei TaxID=8439 RepID=UPI003F59B57E
MSPPPEPAHPRTARLLSALLYGVSSFLIVLVNKRVLTTYSFPSSTFLGIGQMAITIIILYVGKLNRIITFPDFHRQIPKNLFPLPLLYIGNHLTGLSSTKKLSLPMFTVLRKFSIPFTLVLEMIILSFDLSFNLEGYILVFLNDFFTASYGVYTKEKINSKELGKYGVLFYNAFFMIIPTFIYTFWTGDLEQAISYREWTNVAFTFQFLLSCVMGFILLYATVLCSYYNSALTTTVVGAIKNVSVAYIGVFIGGDYSFSWLNFLGLNVCMAGGVAYSFLILRGDTSSTEHRNANDLKELQTVYFEEEQKNGVTDYEESRLLSRVNGR